MNIFEHYLSEITQVILRNKSELKLNKLDDLNNISLEVPPEQFNYDLSCNVALVLGKSNKLNPRNLAMELKNIFQSKIQQFDTIEIAGPGFLNIKLSKNALIKNINSILDNSE